MIRNEVKVGEVTFSNQAALVVICGLNVIESEELALETASVVTSVCRKLGMPCVFKASFDKANRSSVKSFRGIGFDAALNVLEKIKFKYDVPVLTDVHLPDQVESVANVADVLQLPAFLARQTDLIEAMARTGAVINIKKPQFLNPSQVLHVINKFLEFDNDRLLICERGSQFGYDNLVVDMLGFGVVKQVCQDIPVIFGVTHSLQMREQNSEVSGGRRSQILPLARAGIGVGLSGLFVETHPSPDLALCDGASALPLDKLEAFLKQILELDRVVKELPVLEIN